MSRDVPMETGTCDECNETADVFDFMGDFLCRDCAASYYSRQEQKMNNKLSIQVMGMSGSGKSTIIQLIERALLNAGFSPDAIEIQYLTHRGITEPPPVTPFDMRLHSLLRPESKMQIHIVERHLRRMPKGWKLSDVDPDIDAAT